jgi:hypothetical protein
MKIVIRPESIEVSSHKRATGVIYFADNQMVFPEANWNDFVDVLLLEWSRQLLGVASGKVEQVTLRFMDGPFSVGLVCEATQCRALFKHGDKIVGSVGEIQVADLIQSFMNAGESLLSNRAILTQMPKEAAELRVALNQLKSGVPQARQ